MNLLDKYNIPGPRYTSYPTVPYWENSPSEQQWREFVRKAFDAHNDSDGISLYIHLPYCESLCTFCGCTTRITVNHAVETPYINALLSEWNMYLKLFGRKPNIKEIHLGGGTPTFFSPSNLRRLIKGLKSSANLRDDAVLGFEANPATTTFEHLRALADEGFTRLSLGIQDFDPLVQKTINRLQSFEQVNSVVSAARSIGYDSINFDLVYGLPNQTLRSIELSMDMLNLLRPDRIAFYSYAHVPWVKPGQRSFDHHDLPNAHLKHEMYVLGKQMLKDVGYIDIGMDHFALPEDELAVAFRTNTLHRNFMGYTTQSSRLLIGLGVSSISDTWTAFAQNVKSVKGYLAAVEDQRFPLFRGHILTQEDLAVRKTILDLMCKFEGSVDQLESDVMAMETSLLELEKDGLIFRNEEQIRVTETGRSFVRNVCMALDKRLMKSKPETQVFSSTI